MRCQQMLTANIVELCRLFWCSRQSIESISTDGTGRMTHATSTFNNFVAISLHMVS